MRRGPTSSWPFSCCCSTIRIRKSARRRTTTLNRLPAEALSKFLSRPDVSVTLREFFAARGVAVTAGAPAEVAETPLVDVDVAEPGDEDLLAEGDDDQLSVSQKISKMTFTQRLKAASKGTREMRAILVRDTNKMIAAAVMSSPKLTEQEVESIARMAAVSEDVLRMIAHNRAWLKSYKVVLGSGEEPEDPRGHQHEPAAARELERPRADRRRSERSGAPPPRRAEKDGGQQNLELRS